MRKEDIDKKKFDILGTTYTIIVADDMEEFANGEAVGLCGYIMKCIYISEAFFNKKFAEETNVEFSMLDLGCTLRHEIIHAFLYESGVQDNAMGCECWATNEEMVDFFAIQYPKMVKVYKELGIEK